MPPAYEVLLLNTAIPQIQAAQAGDTYVVPRDIAINATAIISANSATDALRITQTGAGNAILVEDSANPDSTPFVVDAAGNVGIGTSSPNAPLTFASATGRKVGFFPATQGYSIGVESSEFRFVTDSSAVFSWRNGSTYSSASEYMRLDSSGNLGLATNGTSFQWINSGNNVALNGTSGVLSFYTGTSSYVERARIASNGQFQWSPDGTTQAMTLDASGNLGVGATNPSAYGKLAVDGNISLVSYTQTMFANKFQIVSSSGDMEFLGGSSNILFKTGVSNTERARITSGGIFQVSSGGSVQVGGTAARATTAGTNRLDIFDGTAPVGTLSNGISIYSSSGEAYVMDAAGNATLFSPHDAETNEWIFKSKHTPTGKTLKIDVEKLLRFINDHFGLDAVHEFIEE